MRELPWALLRFAFGLLLAVNHGYGKVFGGKMAGFTNTVAEMGFPFPAFFAWCAGLTEFVGGILLAVGLLTRPTGLFVAFTMLVAMYRHLPDPFSKMEGSMMFFVFAVVAVLVGGGRYSLDRVLRLRLPFEPRV